MIRRALRVILIATLLLAAIPPYPVAAQELALTEYEMNDGSWSESPESLIEFQPASGDECFLETANAAMESDGHGAFSPGWNRPIEDYGCSYLTAIHPVPAGTEIHELHVVYQTSDTYGNAPGHQLVVGLYDESMAEVWSDTLQMRPYYYAHIKEFDAAITTARYVAVHFDVEWGGWLDYVALMTPGMPAPDDWVFPHPAELSALQLQHTERAPYAEDYTGIGYNNRHDTRPVTPLSLIIDNAGIGQASSEMTPVLAPTDAIVTGVIPFLDNYTDPCAPSSGMNVSLHAYGSNIRDDVEGAVSLIFGAYDSVADRLDYLAAGTAQGCRYQFLGMWEDWLVSETQIITLYVPSEGVYLNYWLLLGDEFVEIGQNVTAGCVMGLSVPSAWGDPSESNDWLYWTYLWSTDDLGEPTDVLPYYGTYSEPRGMCSAPNFQGDCINENPSFDGYDDTSIWGWGLDDADRPVGSRSGLLLQPLAADFPQQVLILDSTVDYGIKLVASVYQPNDDASPLQLELTLGTTTHTVTIDDGGYSETIIDMQQYAPDLGGGHTLSVELAAGQTGTALLQYLCIDDDPQQPTPQTQCIFANAGFEDDDDAAWTLTDAGPFTATIGNGALTLEAGTTASQTPLPLLADSYTLQTTFRPIPSLVPPIGSAQTIDINASGGNMLVGDYWRAQSFAPPQTGRLTRFAFTLGANAGAPAGALIWEIRNANGDVPGIAIATDSLYPVPSQENQIAVLDGPVLQHGQDYWLVLRPEVAQTSGVGWNWVYSGTSIYSGGVAAYSPTSGYSWQRLNNFDAAATFEIVSQGYNSDLQWTLTDDASAQIATETSSSTVAEWTTVESAPFLVASEITSGTFTMTSPAHGVQVDHVCLIPQTLPVQPPEPGVDSFDCNACARTLIGDLAHDVPETVNWLACEQQRVYYCDMRRILTETRDGVNNTVRGIGMTGRWMSMSAASLGKWGNSAAYYLGGHIDNVARTMADSIAWQQGWSTTIYEDGNDNLWDVLSNLINGLADVITTAINGLLAPVAGTLLSVLQQAVGLLMRIINAVLEQVGFIGYLFAGLVDAAANTPASAAGGGLPVCDAATPEGICWGFYVFDNTIFSSQAARSLIPILLAVLAISVIIWAITRFREALSNV